MTPLQVEMIRVEVARGWCDEVRTFAAQADLQPGGDRLGDLVLDRENVRHLAVIALGPEAVAAADVHELSADPQPVARPPHAPLEHGRHLELRPDLGEIDPLSAERERRGPRRDAQAGQLREGVDDLFGDALAEILEVGVAAQVRERQYGYRLASLSLGGRFVGRSEGKR